MAVMLTGGQRLGLLSTTTLSNLSLTSTSAALNDTSKVNCQGGGPLGPIRPYGGITRTAGVSSNANSVVLIKLTDSAFNAIDDYVKKRNHQQLTALTNLPNPTIQFLHQSGTISIPSLLKPGACPGGNQNGSEPTLHTFKFSISDTLSDSGPQGSFECLESKKCGSVETLGAIQKKLQIHASADVYQRFGDKVVAAKKESRKRQPLLLDRCISRGLVTSRKVVRKAYHPAAGAAGSNNPLTNKIHLPSIANSCNADRSIKSNHPSPFRPLGTRCASLVSGSQQLSTNHPKLDRYSKMPHYTEHKSQTNTQIMKRARERIVNLLGRRACKKPELLVRINQDPHQNLNIMSPSPRRNDAAVLPDQNNLAFTNNDSKNRILSLTADNTTSIAQDSDYTQGQRNMTRQVLIKDDACQSSRNIINSYPLYDSDMVGATEVVNDAGKFKANHLVEHQEGLHETYRRLPEEQRIHDETHSSLPSSPKQFAGTEFRKEYIQIQNRTTRKIYKEEFSRNYDRYRELHCKIEKRMAEKVQKEYPAMKDQPEFLAMKEEFEYLHQKMAHIKKLVKEFDGLKVNSS